MKHLKRIVSAGAILAAATMGFAAQAHATLSPAGTCPDVTGSGGTATDCNLQVVFGPNGSITTQTGPQANYDGVEDAFIGVVNDSGATLDSFNISGAEIFRLDGDGIDLYAGIPANTMDTTGYGGPMGYFTNINGSMSSGTVNFMGGLANGGTTYFSLEESININQPPVIGNVPEPASFALMGIGLFAGRRSGKRCSLR